MKSTTKSARQPLFGLIITIVIWNLIHLATGAALTGTLAYALNQSQARPNWFYRWGTDVQDRVRLGFFFCSIPLFNLLVSSVELWRISIYRLPSRLWIGLSAEFALILWTVQFSLEGTCAWSAGQPIYGTDWCPFAWGGERPMPWGQGLGVTWVLPIFVAPLWGLYIAYFICGLKKRQAVQSREVAFPVDAELPADKYGNRASTRAETMTYTSGQITRLPSYRTADAASLDSVDEKEAQKEEKSLK